MTTIEDGLHSHLAADAGVSALVAARIYPLWAPQKPTAPYVVYSRINTERLHHLSGSSALANPHFQFDVFAETFADMVAVAAALRAALDNYSGGMGSPVLTVGSVMVVDERDTFEPDTGLYHDQLDFSIWHDD